MMILFSEAFRRAVKDSPLVYVDAGARGGLQGPWKDVKDDRILVISFEPDPDALIPDTRGKPPQFVFRHALWKDDAGVTLHVGKEPSTSSVYPPNFDILDRFLAQHGEPRRTAKTLPLTSIDLDKAMASIGKTPDFIKIDTHSSEYEILLGARTSLTTACGVLVETWTSEVHKGQKLTGDILVFMKDSGFQLFDLSTAAAWDRRDGTGKGKRQITGLDLLFFRDPKDSKFGAPVSALKAAAIYELYGFVDLATEVLRDTPWAQTVKPRETHAVLHY